jgi:prepilin-type N-terminal cleavage/methylation domain-containing protein
MRFNQAAGGPMHLRQQSAFTLIEMLVVVAIIGVIMAILLPGLSLARRSAQGVAGGANLRSMGGVMTAYTTENRGEFYNPFRSSTNAFGSTLIVGNRRWTFGSDSYTALYTEGFAAYWYSFMRVQDPQGGLAVDAQVSPADAATVRIIRDEGSSKPDGLSPSSCLYSAAFWKSPDEFSFVSQAGGGCPSPYGEPYRPQCPPNPPYLATTSRVGVEDVSYPSSKVMFYERADFQQRSRVRVSGGKGEKQMVPPAWNNPRARPQVATADGSVSRVDMYDLTSRAAANLSQDPTRAFLPVDLLEAPDEMPFLATIDSVSIDRRPARDGLYPYFFGVTRYGVRGRDIFR